MSRTSVGCSQPIPCSGRKALRRCRNRREIDNVILIDVDSDGFDNVIIVDVPESLENKFRRTSVLRNDKKVPWETVICLDDDEITDNSNAHTGVEIDENVNNGASSSKRSCPVSENYASSSNSLADDCQFIRENVPPVKLSKCKRTYSGKGSTRNQYGLGADTESGSSDTDYLDCELMEGPFGRLREQWEKAFLKRKCDNCRGQSGVEDPEMVSNEAHQNVNVADENGQHEETAFVDKECEEKEAPAGPIPISDIDFGSNSYNSVNGVVDNDYLLQSMLKTRFPYGKADNPCGRGSLTEEPSYDNVEHHCGQHFEMGGSSFYRDEEQGPHVPDSFPGREWGTRDVNYVERAFQNKEKASFAEPRLSGDVPCGVKTFSYGEPNFVDKEPSVSQCLRSVNDEVDCGTPISRDKKTNRQERLSSSNSHLQQETKHRVETSNEKSVSEQASTLDPRNHDRHVTETFFSNSSVFGMERNNGNDLHPHNTELIPENPSITNSHINKVPPVHSHSCSVSVNEEPMQLVSDSQMEDAKDDPVHGLDAGVMLNSEGCIFIGRERLKETDEFKRALEEELASRQRALQIQAEEAQNLRRLQKRKKAEIMRLLDMERRQKQRVEEIREIQKKDEENMNLKEVIRAAVRKELNQLELTCHDMASVLRGLGILVGVVGQHPSLNEVRLAYKRALLTFHPDRASRSDVRQQVEAEEKFKLISRMKDKFLLT